MTCTAALHNVQNWAKPDENHPPRSTTDPRTFRSPSPLPWDVCVHSDAFFFRILLVLAGHWPSHTENVLNGPGGLAKTSLVCWSHTNLNCRNCVLDTLSSWYSWLKFVTRCTPKRVFRKHGNDLWNLQKLISIRWEHVKAVLYSICWQLLGTWHLISTFGMTWHRNDWGTNRDWKVLHAASQIPIVLSPV